MTDTKILVTGGVGYVGSRLIRDLPGDPAFGSATVRVLDNMQAHRYAGMADLPPEGRYEFYEGDIMDPEAVRRALEGVDVVIHLAALVRTPFSFDHPTWTEHVNHWGTARLVEDCKAAGVSRFVLASSSSVYGPGDDRSEDDECAPIGPYSQSKLNAEKAVRAASDDRGLDVTILRMATVYGDAPAIRFDAVPNRFAYLAATGRPIPVHGRGDQVRPIIHVRDAASAIRHILRLPVDERRVTYNLVGANESVQSMAETVRDARPFSDLRYTAQHELARFSLSLRGDALEATGWAPEHDLEDGVTEILDRYGRFAASRPTPTHADMGA